jgi:hypothetical protein
LDTYERDEAPLACPVVKTTPAVVVPAAPTKTVLPVVVVVPVAKRIELPAVVGTATAPIVPVHTAPWGQQATEPWLSIAHRALFLQQSPALPAYPQLLYPDRQLLFWRLRSSSCGRVVLSGPKLSSRYGSKNGE